MLQKQPPYPPPRSMEVQTSPPHIQAEAPRGGGAGIPQNISEWEGVGADPLQSTEAAQGCPRVLALRCECGSSTQHAVV